MVKTGWVQIWPGGAGRHAAALGADEIKTGIDFGTAQRSVIRGAKWSDLKPNGEHDPGEPGLQGWTIYLDLNNNSQLDDDEPADAQPDADDPFGGEAKKPAAKEEPPVSEDDPFGGDAAPTQDPAPAGAGPDDPFGGQ